MSTFEKIAVFPMKHEAETARVYLESQDIPAFVRSEQVTGALSGYAMGMGGAALLVPSELAEEAKELLAAAQLSALETDIPWDQEQKDEETGETLPLEKPSSLTYSRTFLWVVMPLITIAILLIVWIILYFFGSALLDWIRSLQGDAK
jgi:hypothetical protein